MEWDYPLHAFFDERRADMSSTFEDMNMEVCMEENPFEEAGLPAGDPGKGENGLPDGFMDSMDAFGEKPFDSDGQGPDAASLPAQEETVSDGAWEDAEESAGPESDGAEETGEPEEAGEPAEAGEPNEAGEPEAVSEAEKEREESLDAEEEAEDKKRAEHEAAEARRKAEWEARQQAKKDAEQAQLARLSSLSDEEVTAQAMKRVGADTERLTRRNMKECVSEYIQTLCLEDPDFSRLTMHPRKTMIHCFFYINRKAREFVEQEMKDNDIKPENGVYGSDVPDDLCYQWAEEYFRDPDAKEDQEKEEKFVPRAYNGKSNVKSKSTKTVGKKTAGKEKNGKKEEKKPQEKGADGGQFEQMTLAGLAG